MIMRDARCDVSLLKPASNAHDGSLSYQAMIHGIYIRGEITCCSKDLDGDARVLVTLLAELIAGDASLYSIRVTSRSDAADHAERLPG